MQIKKQAVALAVGGLMALTMTGGGMKAWAEKGEKGEDKEVKITLPAAQLKAATAAALAAKPGKVLETEAEVEGGKTQCEVKIQAADGKTYEVIVDVASNKVVKVGLDDDDKDDEDEGEQDKD